MRWRKLHRLHRRQAATSVTHRRVERVIATGVEDDQIRSISPAAQFAQHQFEFHGAGPSLRLETRGRVHQHQIVTAAGLDAMTGEMEQRGRARRAVERIGELRQRSANLNERRVLDVSYLEPKLTELRRHRPRVVHRVLERRLCVARIAHDERIACLRCR